MTPSPEHAPPAAEEGDTAHEHTAAEQMMVPREDGEVALSPDASESPTGRTLFYWLWRATGRRLARGDAAQLAEHYERELVRQAASLRSEHEKALSRQRDRIAKLERLTNQLEHAYHAEITKLRDKMAQSRRTDPQEVEQALNRAEEAEARARLAENKVEMLKEALEIQRARNSSAALSGGFAASADDRFREAKRAFARTFHPDLGGRDDIAKQQTFLEFWPVLERIERGE